jgi:hypothetical protein
MAVHHLIGRSAPSFVRWRPRTPYGARRGFTANCARSASTSQSARSHVCWNRTHARRRRRGRRFTNHLASAASMDFFTVPTLTGRVLFVVIVLSHVRRRIVHFNITEHPTDEWTTQQVIDAFPDDTAPRLFASRSRQRLQRDVPASRGGHGHRRGGLSAGESLAESVRRTRDRVNSSRMPGSCDRAQSGASPTHPQNLQPVLSSDSNTPGAGEGRARAPTRLGHVRGTNHRDSGSRRPSSPLRTAGSISSGSAGARKLDINVLSARVAHSPFR